MKEMLMQNKVFCRVTLLTLFLSIMVFSQVFSGVVDKIVVVVNDEPITQSEIDNKLQPFYQEYKEIYEGDELYEQLDKTRKKILDALVMDRLILSVAKAQNIEIDEQEMERRFGEISNRFSSDEEFETALLSEHTTIAEIKSDLRDRLMIERAVEVNVSSKITVSPTEIQKYYDDRPETFKVGESRRIANITIKPKPGEKPDQIRARAQEIAVSLKEGADFGKTASRLSDGPHAKDGGDMGFIKEGQLLARMDEAAFALKPNEISDVIETGFGYHILKLLEIEEARVLPLEEIKGKIKNVVYGGKIEAALNKWVDKLKEDAYISYK